MIPSIAINTTYSFLYYSLVCTVKWFQAYLCGAFNKFPDFFCTGIWNCRTLENPLLLLYILWDDWPIHDLRFKWQLQQKLGYTLLKSDYYSWWILKMQSDTFEERYAIKFCSRHGKNATKTYGMLQTSFGASCMNRTSVFEWLKRFKEGKESVRDDGRCKEVNTPELIG